MCMTISESLTGWLAPMRSSTRSSNFISHTWTYPDCGGSCGLMWREISLRRMQAPRISNRRPWLFWAHLLVVDLTPNVLGHTLHNVSEVEGRRCHARIPCQWYKAETQQGELTLKQIRELSFVWTKKMPCLGGGHL